MLKSFGPLCSAPWFWKHAVRKHLQAVLLLVVVIRLMPLPPSLLLLLLLLLGRPKWKVRQPRRATTRLQRSALDAALTFQSVVARRWTRRPDRPRRAASLSLDPFSFSLAPVRSHHEIMPPVVARSFVHHGRAMNHTRTTQPTARRSLGPSLALPLIDTPPRRASRSCSAGCWTCPRRSGRSSRRGRTSRRQSPW